MVPATDEVVETAPIDMGDIGKSESARNSEIAAALFPDDEPAEPVVEVPETPAEKAERVRDEKGRFAQKSEAKDEPVVKEEPKVEQKADATVAPDPAAPPPAPEPDIEPLQWLAYGKPVEIPGAQYKPGHGVFIPDSQVPQLRQAWARGHERYPQIVNENAELRQALSSVYTRREAEAYAVIEVLGQHFGSEQAFQQFLQYASESPALALREIRAMLKEKQLELGQNVSEPAERLTNPQVDAADVAEALTDEMELMFRQPEFRGKFTPAQQRDLTNRVFGRANAYLTRADADYPAHGIKKGDLVVNTDALLNDVRYEVSRGAAPKPPATATPAVPSASTSSAPPPPPPPSAVGRSRTTAAPKQSDSRKKSTIPTRSLQETADWLVSDDE